MIPVVCTVMIHNTSTLKSKHKHVLIAMSTTNTSHEELFAALQEHGRMIEAYVRRQQAVAAAKKAITQSVAPLSPQLMCDSPEKMKIYNYADEEMVDAAPWTSNRPKRLRTGGHRAAPTNKRVSFGSDTHVDPSADDILVDRTSIQHITPLSAEEQAEYNAQAYPRRANRAAIPVATRALMAHQRGLASLSSPVTTTTTSAAQQPPAPFEHFVL